MLSADRTERLGTAVIGLRKLSGRQIHCMALGALFPALQTPTDRPEVGSYNGLKDGSMSRTYHTVIYWYQGRVQVSD